MSQRQIFLSYLFLSLPDFTPKVAYYMILYLNGIEG